ncbi:MFS transporter [Kitasatospora viridis]|uniref:MFS transporter n=1 Tax=Kitasatospora viridis TaxID=281105 RepID=A0A561UB86_9ACTN|nr:MFS transporter [Kitasatospora viridis]TWF96606.1 MFS transporter [Kitasatospora viridis]
MTILQTPCLAATSTPREPGPLRLLLLAGGRRYAAALVVDALGTGLLRPFLLLYGVSVLGLSPGRAGLALSLGLLVGLAALPLTGRWIDRGARSLPVAATLLVRAAGVLALLLVPGADGFTLAAVLLGLGSQSWPTAHAATVAALVTGRTRDDALAAGRSLRNAGLGAGALLATVALAGGAGSLRALAVLTALACAAAAALVWSLRLTAPAAPPRHREAGPADRASTLLSLANLPFAFCFDVLEVALPALLVTRLQVSAAWSSGIFVGNTVLVITTQLLVVRRLSGRARRSVLTLGGALLAASYLGFWVAGGFGGAAGAGAICLVAVVYTAGEIVYTGAGTALVMATAPPERLGRALARWELSNGLGAAAAPATLTALLAAGPGLLWGTLAAATALGAAAMRRTAPQG